jgi:acetyl-CoA carboxylase biotin carboxylase subunit
VNANSPVRRLFVANRGEIAVRIVAACRKLGIEVVVGVSEADRDTLAARLADRAVCIGPAHASESYLRKETIVAAAKGTGCDAVHPGYGFLAERASFRKLCDEQGLCFVGPSAQAIDAMGDKLQARSIAKSAGVPTVPGSDRVDHIDDAIAFGRSAGYPFLLKASAGGGGRGMRVVHSPAEVPAAYQSASAEAQAAFGDRTLYIERYVENARHVEVQVMGDAYGTVIHLGERDCSVQRRHQKLIEEAPSPILGAAMRSAMTDAAVRLAECVSYVGAGTVEFIVDVDAGAFYFLEMNTRIQVEHPVTEMVTEVDLVAEMIRVAGGASLSLAQNQVVLRGHAIEFRINAESVERGFMPSPGRLTRWKPPQGPGIRVDTHCYPGYLVPPFYDSMLAKLIVHGADRESAVTASRRALADFEVDGVHTTIPFHRAVLCHPDFVQNKINTSWVERVFMKTNAFREYEPT